MTYWGLSELPRVVHLFTTYSYSGRWDREGRCFYRENNGPEERRPELDFGTPMGDLMVDPWMQEVILKKGQE